MKRFCSALTMTHCCLAFLLLLAANIAPSRGATLSPHAIVRCKELKKASPQLQAGAYSWVEGFISGRNAYALDGKMPNFTNKRVALELNSYCELFPDEFLVNAAIAIIARLNDQPDMAFRMLWRLDSIFDKTAHNPEFSRY